MDDRTRLEGDLNQGPATSGCAGYVNFKEGGIVFCGDIPSRLTGSECRTCGKRIVSPPRETNPDHAVAEAAQEASKHQGYDPDDTRSEVERLKDATMVSELEDQLSAMTADRDRLKHIVSCILEKLVAIAEGGAAEAGLKELT